MTTPPNAVSFFLNGKAVTIDDPSPDLLLIDYLRSPEVALAGPKKPCGQGGCGGCTVILSRWDEKKEAPEHRAVNSCLRPVCALGGLVVTTVEGTGAARRPNPELLLHSTVASRAAAPLSAAPPPAHIEAADAAREKHQAVLKAVRKARHADAPAIVKLVTEVAAHPSEHSHEGMNPVAHALALNNGSQCGYCSVGFVMNMSEFITNHPDATKKQIEEAFDGNLCRCTGYRAILTGMKTFAADWTAQDEAHRMKCLGDEGCEAQLPGRVAIPFPPEARGPLEPVTAGGAGQQWRTPVTLAELADILHTHRERKIRLVHGNTSFGIYKDEFPSTQLFIDIRLVPELNAAPVTRGDELVVSAGCSYSDLLELLSGELKARRLGETSPLGAIDFMARRTAGRIVRNAASLGGNTMLVLKHLTHGEPFPSDVFTALAAVDARISYLVLDAAGRFTPQTATPIDLVGAVAEDPTLADRIVLVSYALPLGGAQDAVLAQKVALREVNAHSIVNATTRFTFGGKLVVADATLVYGGIAPYPWRPRRTEAALAGRKLSLERFGTLARTLAREVRAELKRWAKRMAEVPDEGFTAEYRTQLAVAFLYKAIVNALIGQGAPVPPAIKSAGEITWGHWRVSGGRQHYVTQAFKRPVGQPYIKITAMYQTSGQLHYTQELALPPLAVNGAFVQSRRALADYHFVIPGGAAPVDASALRAHLSDVAPEFVDLVTHENIGKGGLNHQGMGADQPLFAVDRVSYVGQSIALVLAKSEPAAARIAEYVSAKCVAYQRPDRAPWTRPPWNEPILDLFTAIKANSIFPDAPAAAPFVAHIWRITRPGSQFDWTTAGKDPLDRSIVRRPANVGSAPCVVVESTQLNGGQVHFYMETQACVAEPLDEGRIAVHPSTQSPQEMHATTAMALGVHYHQVEVEVAPVGGGFGGKTEQARFVTGPTAVAARAIKRPVRVAVPRDQDTALIGKRHAYYAQYQIAVDRGEVRPQDKGLIRGLLLDMWGDGGAFYDCSFIVSNCIQMRTDNAYRIPNFQSQIDVCRTNTAPSTAFRAFGDIQGKNMVENAIDDAAFAIGLRPEELREKNLYDLGDVTPFGQALTYCYMKQVWAYLKQVSRYDEKRAAVDDFNRKNRWRKRGLGMLPVKYGSGYNLVLLEQAGVVLVVNQADGTIVVHQSGVEIGQGLATQALQVAAYVLNVPMGMIYIDNTRTSITPNPTSTGASTGTPYAAEAVKRTCQSLRQRLTEFAYQLRNDHGDDWCRSQGIDFWNHPEKGWATPVELANGRQGLIWQFLVSVAFAHRVNLLEALTTKMHGGETQVPVMTFKPEELQPNPPGIERVKDAPLGGGVDLFPGFTYSAALSVVEVDILTGETKILSSDIVYDMGWSMNPAIDIGQVEGAFVQGIGYLTSEKLVFEPAGEERGRLNTTNTWRYKIPAVTEIPLELNTYLFPRNLPTVRGIPDEPNDVFSAKEVGEPPLVLANSVFFAIKAAIRESRLERGLGGLFRFDAPATVQEVRRACELGTGLA